MGDNPTSPREGDTATGTKLSFGIGVTSTGAARADLIRIKRGAKASTSSTENTNSGAVAVADLEPQQDAPINISTSGSNSIISAPGTGKRIAVWSILIMTTGTPTFTPYGGTTLAKSGPLKKSFSHAGGGMNPIWRLPANKAFTINVGSTNPPQISGTVSYTVQAAT